MALETDRIRSWMVAENDAIEEAARRPLLDAAYYLWRLRHKIPQKNPPILMPVDYKNRESVLQAMQASRNRAQQVYADAENGETFERLKAAHPQSNDEDLQGMSLLDR